MCINLDPQYKPQHAADVVAVILFAQPLFLREGDPLCVTSAKQTQWPARNCAEQATCILHVLKLKKTMRRQYVC